MNGGRQGTQIVEISVTVLSRIFKTLIIVKENIKQKMCRVWMIPRKEGKQKEPRSDAQAFIQMQEEPVVVQQV